jgi:hypothetical protein
MLPWSRQITPVVVGGMVISNAKLLHHGDH